MKTLKLLILTTTLSLFAVSANAFLTIGESTDVTPKGTLKLGIEPQIRLSEGSGANLSVFLDGGIQEDLSWRAQLGAGETDLSLGASVKWVPYPDFEKQPAVGFRGDFFIGREANETFTTFRVAPMVGKQLQTDLVLFAAYVALPLGIQGYQGKTETLAQLALGSDIHLDDWKNSMFNVELGANVNKAFSYLSFNYVYIMNDKSGLKVRTRSRD